MIVPVFRIVSAVLLLVGVGTLVATAEPPASENWPGWRGPRGDGTSLECGLPTQWNGATGQNIAWKTEIPGVGHASPIVWEDRVFVVSCREEKQQRILLCLDFATGRILWEQTVVTAPLERKHRLNSHASSTPATDGMSVYVTFLDGDRLLAAAYDFEGNRRWLVHPGAFHSVHGYCTSIVLFENLVLINGDHDGDAYLAALDKQTGATVWKTPRENKTRSYCAPIIREIGGRTQMILSGSKCVASYDPRTGARHWILDGPTEQFVASPIYNGKLLLVTAGFPEFHILALRPDQRGLVSDADIVWRTTKGCSYVPSPIVGGDGRYFLVVSDDGIGSCFEVETGRRLWTQRMGPHYSASLISVDGLVHFLADDGATKIVRPGPKFDLVATSALGEPCCASPAVSRRAIFLRAAKHLYCIRAPGGPTARQPK
jgi:outer membrane protein assembly factor BamB